MNTTNPEFELMRQEIYRIGGKIDALPQIYITRNEHDPWRNSVEKRFDEVNKQFDELDKLKNENARWTIEERTRIHNQIQETERHLQANQEKISEQMLAMHNKVLERIDEKLEKQDDKQDAATQNTWSWRQAWLIAGFSLGGTAVIAVVSYLISALHLHP